MQIIINIFINTSTPRQDIMESLPVFPKRPARDPKAKDC